MLCDVCIPTSYSFICFQKKHILALRGKYKELVRDNAALDRQLKQFEQNIAAGEAKMLESIDEKALQYLQTKFNDDQLRNLNITQFLRKSVRESAAKLPPHAPPASATS